MKALAHKQRGVSFVGMIMIATGIVLAAILGLKVIPPYVHSAQIGQIFRSIAGDPAMRDASLNEIKESYNKRAEVNMIKDLTAEDIEITRDDGVLRLSAQYSVKIPLVGNITLLLDFNPSSS